MDISERSKRKWVQRPASAVYIFCRDLKVAVYPSSPASHHPLLHSLPPPLCWPAPLHASQGRFLPQLGVLGCVAACLYWSVDFLVAACTYLNIPPAAAPCSRPRTASAPPPPPPPTHPHPAHSALSHTLFPPSLSLLHCGSSHYPILLYLFRFFSLIRSFPFSCSFSLRLSSSDRISSSSCSLFFSFFNGLVWSYSSCC